MPYDTLIVLVTALVQKGSKQGHHHQPPEDSALQVEPHMQEVFLLPVHHIRGHLAPQMEELPTFRGERSQWVILISVTTGTKHARSIFTQWEPGWRIWGRAQCLLAHLIGDTPTPSVWTWKEDQREDLLLTNLMHTYHLSLPTCKLGNCCQLWIQGCVPCLWRVLHFTNIRG